MKKDVLNPKKQISVSLPLFVLQDMDILIDGSHIRSRSHLMHIAVVDYIARAKIDGLPKQLTISDIKDEPRSRRKPKK
jgi:metal-responsive CopG/Arc/MetJ family transcriptional regulator